MRLSEIKTGTAYALRDDEYAPKWGVPVTVSQRFDTYYSNAIGCTVLSEGNKVLVITPFDLTVDVEQGVAAAATATIPATGVKAFSEMADKLAVDGMTLETWAARSIEGEYAEVLVNRRQRLDAKEAENHAKRVQQQELRRDFDDLRNVLGIDINPRVAVFNNEVKMTVDEWRILINRIESLSRANPLLEGNL